MMDLVLLFSIAAYAYWLGRRVLRSFGYEFTTWAGGLSAATGLGLGLVAYAILAVGLTGWLNLAGVLCSAALLAVFVHVPWLAAQVRLLFSCVDSCRPPHPQPLSPRCEG